MKDLLEDRDKAVLQELIEKYTTAQKEQERSAELFFSRVEKLLKNSETFKIPNDLKIEMADRAVAKQAPFHNSKNNMADALLYFGAVAHVKKTTEIASDLIFVTSNSKEFSDPSDITKLHPDLYKGNVHFYNNLARVLQMRKETIDLLDEYTEWQLWQWIESEAEIARGK